MKKRRELSGQLSPLSDQKLGDPILKKPENEYNLDPIDSDDFELAETERILGFISQKYEVNEIAGGELVVKIEKGGDLPQVKDKPNFNFKFKLIKYNLAQLAKNPNANIHTIFKDEKEEKSKNTTQNE